MPLGIFLETAHPAKFKEVVDETLQTSVPIPNDLQRFLQHPKKSIPLSKDYQAFKDFLKQTSELAFPALFTQKRYKSKIGELFFDKFSLFLS